MKTALHLFDAQVNMFDASPHFGAPRMPVYDSEALLERLAELIRWARSAGIPVLYVQHDGGPAAIDEVGTPGFEIQPELAPLPGDHIVVKCVPSAFHETFLQPELVKLGVTSLVIAGMQSELCIDATCRAGAKLGYAITLVADAHSTFDTQNESAAEIIARVNRELGDVANVILATEIHIAS